MVGDPPNLSGAKMVTGSCSPNRIGDVEMSETLLPQLSRLEVQALSKKDPALVQKARLAGQLDSLLAGNDPGCCPTCGRPNMEAK